MGKQASDKPSKPFKKLPDALGALARGDLPKGTKFVIAPAQTVLTKNTKNTRQVFFTFEGSPAQFAKLVLSKMGSHPVKVEIEEATSTAAKPDDDE